MELELIRGVDVVAYTARSMEREIIDAGARRTLHLPNGVDFQHFANGGRSIPADTRLRPPADRGVRRRHGYMVRFRYGEPTHPGDAGHLLRAYRSDSLAREGLVPRADLHILGPKPFVILPAYLHNADVGFIPFDVQAYPALVHAVHPLKLYQYLACDLPVVATRWDELERLASPAILCDSVMDFQIAIRKALTDPPDSRTGRDYARAADWRGRVDLILAALGGTEDRGCPWLILRSASSSRPTTTSMSWLDASPACRFRTVRRTGSSSASMARPTGPLSTSPRWPTRPLWPSTRGPIPAMSTGVARLLGT